MTVFIRESDGLLPVPRDAMHARKRPLAVGLYWCWESLLALALGSAVASVAQRAYGSHPDGDGPLFRAGALELLDFLVHSMGAAGPVLSLLLLVLGAALIGGLIPSAMLMVSIAYATRARGAPRMPAAMGRATAAFAPSVTVTLVSGVVQLAMIIAGVVASHFVGPAALARYGEPGSDKAVLATVAATLFFVLIVGAFGDIARAAIIRFQVRGLRALVGALHVFARSPVSLTWAYVWRTGASLVPIAIVEIVTMRLGGRSGLPLVALVVIHQAALAARAAIRASWLSRALRAVDR